MSAPESKPRESWWSGLFGISTRGFGALFQLVITIVIGRTIGASGVALYIAMSTWFRVAEVFLGLGMSPQLLRDGARLSREQSALGLFSSGVRAARPMLLGSIAVGVTVAALALGVGATSASIVIVFAGFGGAAAARLKLLVDLLKARRWARSALAFEFSVAPVLTMCIIGVLAVLDVPISGVTWVVAYSSGTSLSMVGAELMLRRNEATLRVLPVKTYSGRSAESRRFMNSALLSIGLWATPILLLPLMVSGSDAGRFSLAFRLLSVADLILAGLAAVFAPAFAKAWAENRVDDLRRHYRRSRWLAIATFTPFMLGVVIFGRTVLGVFGEEFVAAYPVLLIAAAGHGVNAVTGLVSELLLMTRAEDKELQIGATALGFMAVALVPASLAFGIVGAAVVYSTSLVLKNVLALVAVKRRLRATVLQLPVESFTDSAAARETDQDQASTSSS